METGRDLGPTESGDGAFPSLRTPHGAATLRRVTLRSFRWVVLVWLGLFRTSAADPASAHPTSELRTELDRIRRSRGVPALTAGLVRSNVVMDVATVGVRKAGIELPAGPDDLWHLGSLTKSMTATAAAVLVGEGRLRWDSTVGEVLEASVPGMHADWKPVTVAQLLRHHGGAPDHGWLGKLGLWETLWNHPGTPRQQREHWIGFVLTRPPAFKPGAKPVYSNTGYVLVGSMIEAVTGEAWEEWIRSRVFRPMGLSSAGFGVPARPRFIDQPWGHRWEGATPTPVPPGPDADNPSGLGPAGTVHMSLGDLLRYGAFHAAEGRPGLGPVGLDLARPILRELHEAPAGGTDAFGWKVLRRDWGGGDVLTHNGSNNQWFAVLWIAPARATAVAAVTNIGDDDRHAASLAADDAVAWLIRRHLQRPE